MVGAVAAAALAITATSCAGSAVNPEPRSRPPQSGSPLELPVAGQASRNRFERHNQLSAIPSVPSPLSPFPRRTLPRFCGPTYGYRTDGGRTVPSAGGLYALAIFVAIGDVEGVSPGIYTWDPATNQLGKMSEGDPRTLLRAPPSTSPLLAKPRHHCHRGFPNTFGR